jgi:hypothetical protein
MIKSNDVVITALDSYTKLMLHGDAIAESTGKTVTAYGYAYADPNVLFSNSPSINFYSETLNINQIGTDWGANIAFGYPGFEAMGQSFTPASNCYVTKGSFRLKNSSGLFYGSVRAAIHPDDGTGKPDSTVFLEKSMNVLSCSNLTGSYVTYDWIFSGKTQLTAGTVYYFCLYYVGGSSGTNYGHVSTQNGSVYSGGKAFQRGNLVWTPTSPDGCDYNFRIYTRDVSNTASYLTIPDSTDWSFGTGDFTIDCWVKFNDLTGNQVIVSQYQDGTHFWYLFKASTGNAFGVQFNNGATVGKYDMSSWSGVVNTWYHLVFERTTTTAKMFIDGVEQTLTEATAFSTNDVGDLTSVLYIGQHGTGASYFNGWISQLRISKGIARWTANFTPPTTTYGGARTNFIFPVNSNNDVEYKIYSYLVNGVNAADEFKVRINNDYGLAYPFQEFYGQSTTATSAASAAEGGLFIGRGLTNGDVSFSISYLYSLNGIKTFLTEQAEAISGTTVNSIFSMGQSFSLYFLPVDYLNFSCNYVNGIGVGSSLEIWNRIPLPAGPAGTFYDNSSPYDNSAIYNS